MARLEVASGGSTPCFERSSKSTQRLCRCDQAYDHLTTSSKQRKVVITLRESDGGLIKQAQTLGQELFAQQGPGNEEALFGFLKSGLLRGTAR